MAYLPDFSNDIFISYRRAINEGPDRWVESFKAALELQLRQLVGDVSIWRDEERIRTGDDWRQVLNEALAGAAIYVAIISRTYLDSRECRNELDLMLARLRQDAGKERRIFPIYKQPPKSEADMPSELAGTQRREFFQRRQDAPLGFAELDARAEDHEFQTRLAWLAQEVTVALERLRGDAMKKRLGRIFVADVEPGLYRDRDSLVANLQHQHYLVAPENEYLWSSADITQTIRNDLDDALLAVHLVTPAGMPGEAEVHQCRQQIEHALQSMHDHGRPPPLVWIGARAGACASLQALIADIEGPFADKGVEVLTGTLEDLKTHIRTRLQPPAAPGAAGGVRELPVLVDDADLAAFSALRQQVMDPLDIELVRVRLADPATADAAALQAALGGAPRCAVFWGGRGEDWLQQVFRLAPLAPYLGRERLAVLVGAPASDEKTLFSTRKALVLCEAESSGPPLAAFCGTGAGA